MSIERETVLVQDISIDLHRKRIKNLHIGVYPPDGRVRVSAPLHLGTEAVRQAVASRLSWIRKKQKLFAEQDRQSEREYVSGETHYFQGRKYRLDVVEGPGRPAITCKANGIMVFNARSGSTRENRERFFYAWYRAWMKAALPPLLEKWTPVICVETPAWGIKRMKTRWGTCNPRAKRIWLNLELAKKHPAHLEYVLVHELVHLKERSHNERFKALMDEYLPKWRAIRKALNYGPLAHEEWEC